MKTKMSMIFICGLVLLVLTLNIANAGVVNPYWETRPLEMDFGETKTIYFKLTNIGSEDVTYNVGIKKGADIASIEQTEYIVRAGTEDTQVPLTVIIPSDYDRQVQKIELLFTEIEPGQEGMITLSTGYISSFNVILSNAPAGGMGSTLMIISLVVALMVILILILVLFKKK